MKMPKFIHKKYSLFTLKTSTTSSMLINIFIKKIYKKTITTLLIYTFFFIRTKFIRTQAFGHPEINNTIRTQGFPQQ